MLKPAEIYKGIEFVRISCLPADQQENLRSSIKRDQVIKILIGNTLAEDCVQYHDYKAWFYKAFPAEIINVPTTAKVPSKFAFSETEN